MFTTSDWQKCESSWPSIHRKITEKSFGFETREIFETYDINKKAETSEAEEEKNLSDQKSRSFLVRKIIVWSELVFGPGPGPLRAFLEVSSPSEEDE